MPGASGGAGRHDDFEQGPPPEETQAQGPEISDEDIPF
jgi:hypothetical protein